MFATLDKIPTWEEQTREYKKNDILNKKVSIFIGDITTLVVDAIVNSTDSMYSGGGGVDRAIHKAAGNAFDYECKSFGQLNIGQATISGGYNLPAKFVIHTAVPHDHDRKRLEECYWNSLAVALESGASTIAFPCLCTGRFGYPNKDAAHVALRTVRKFLEENESSVDRIVFCIFMPEDVSIYEDLMNFYFPI
ncbi:hypothetical protein JTE90_021978 [Oedothorax gibbosus]|uniref:Macro domain-containing protein n=1 Tax=Oedothorax gibbosus TaxID=931172 RepID=A0AAV6U295_9ARAC|nr:hypothetical protein JTE90_021978 [Oedothorax gibbosus]